MPRQRTPISEEEMAVRRTRVSPYQVRIERTLTDIFFEVPTEQQAHREWTLTHVAHTRGYSTCDMCGHNPIKRLFFIKSASSGREMCIGSECARNYADVDLVNAYLRRIGREQRLARQRAERVARDARIAERRDAYYRDREARIAAANDGLMRNLWRNTEMPLPEYERSEEQQPELFTTLETRFIPGEEAEATSTPPGNWRTINQDLITWLEDSGNFGPGNDFLASLRRWLVSHTELTERQTTAARRIMEERVTRAQRMIFGNGGDEEDAPAEQDECPQIRNGIYTLDGVGAHMTFSIHTVRNGSLRGKRIIRKQNAYMQFEGFAFLTRHGNLKLWRRFAEDAEQPFVEWAKHLLTMLSQEAQEGNGTLLEINQYDADGALWTVQVALRCRRCNRTLTTPTSIQRGIGPECESVDEIPLTVPAPHRSRAVPVRRRGRARTPAASRGGSTSTGTGMSEINPEWEQ